MSNIYPLDAPGFPPVGEDFFKESARRGDEQAEISGKGKNAKYQHSSQLAALVERALFDQGMLQMNITVKTGKCREMPIIGGHRWAANPEGPTPGPEPCEAMVIGKQLGEEEVNKRRCMLGPTGKELLRACKNMEVPGLSKWYVTNLVKTSNPDDGNSWRDAWVKNFLHLLYQEIALVRPKYILCLGADAVKALLGKNMTLGKMEGQIVEHTFDLRKSKDDPPDDHVVNIMACVHPAAVARTPELMDKLELGVHRFGQLVSGIRWDTAEEGLDHRVIDTKADLDKLVKDIRACGRNNIVGMDAEWHGEHPESKGAYVRCIQLSWDYKKAACVVLRRAGGKKLSRGWEKYVAKKIMEAMKYNRPCGHFFVADLEWLVPLGIDLRKQFAPPLDWRKARDEGGLDTALMAHAVDETGDFTLTGQCLRYTAVPRYDVVLIKWKESYCKKHGITSKALEGFGECPDEVLYPYANYDADVTRRLAVEHMKNLDADAYGNNCWEAFWVSQRAALAVLEIKRTGIALDYERVDEMTSLYMQVRDRLARQIRDWANWPCLNLNSTPQMRELMFGEEYNGVEPIDGKFVRLRPSEARSMKAMPVLTTEKRPRKWSDLSPEEELEFNPSTSKGVLGMMAHVGEQLEVRTDEGETVQRDYSDIIGCIRDHRFINQVLKSVLRPPLMSEDGLILTSPEGHWLYGGGIASTVCSDGMVRTTIYQTKETGRWSSARPALQNISKRRESDYKRILGDSYRYPLRSILRAPPGYVIVEADYVGAELFGMAIMADDATMIDHAMRNQLPENDPNFYDIHSNVAVMAFGLPCEPTKGALAAIGKKDLRIVAKAVIFGIAYGRGAKAIALAAKEEGIEITQQESQRIIDTIFELYPGLVEFFKECRERAVAQDRHTPAPRWLCGPFGRFRRFPETNDRMVKGEIERQAQNFPIQGMIADVVSLAIANLYDYREMCYDSGWSKDDLDFKICLQIHDAILALVKTEHVPLFVDEILPACMVESVPVYPCTLDGRPIPNKKPYTLGIDSAVEVHWGITPLPDELEAIGVDPKYAGWKETENGLINPEAYSRKVWSNGALRDETKELIHA